MKIKQVLFALAFLSLTAIAACTHVPRTDLVQSPVLQPADYSATEYYRWVHSAEIEELQGERDRLEVLEPALLDIRSRIQLALLLSASHFASTESEQTALTLLQLEPDYRATPAPQEDYATLADLWKALLQQRAKLRSEIAMRKTAEQEAAKLKSQIDALTSIEQQLLERQQAEPLEQPGEVLE